METFDTCKLTHTSDNTVVCPVCFEPAKRLYDKFELYTCTSCGHVSKEYTHSLSEYYNTVYRTHHPVFDLKTRVGFVTNILTAYESILRKLDANGSFTVLEIGAGDGLLSEKIKSTYKNATVTCVELDTNLAEKLTERGIVDAVVPLSVYDIDTTVQYDVVIMMDVLEHLPYPHSFMSRLAKICSQYWFVQVPIGRSPIPAGQHGWGGHLHEYTKKSLDVLALGYGFELKTVDDTAKKYSVGRAYLCAFERIPS